MVLRAPSEFTSIAELEQLVVRQTGDAAIVLADIAEIRDTHERLTRLVRVDGRTGIRVAIRKEADANTVEVAQAILDEIDAAERALPQIDISR